MLTLSVGTPPTALPVDEPPLQVSDITFVSISDVVALRSGAPVDAFPGDGPHSGEPPWHANPSELPPQTPMSAEDRSTTVGGDGLVASQPTTTVTQFVFIAKRLNALRFEDMLESGGRNDTVLRMRMEIGNIALWELYARQSPEKIGMGPPLDEVMDPHVNSSGEPGDPTMQPGHFKPPVPSPLTGYLAFDVTPASEASNGQGTPSSTSQRAYDSVFQLYSSEPMLFSLEQGNGSGINSVARADAHSKADDGQGGFVELDHSFSADADSATRSDVDLERAAIDALMADLQVFDPSQQSDSNGDATRPDPSGVANDGLPLGDVESWISGAEQGGMVALRSTSSGGSNLISLAGAADASINWSVPTSNVEIEAAVGMYQAFDVATGELSSTRSATVVAPAVKHDHETKNHVSADKVAKPALDQASAWVEMLTVAAVAGASKKERKSRTKS